MVEAKDLDLPMGAGAGASKEGSRSLLGPPSSASDCAKKGWMHACRSRISRTCSRKDQNMRNSDRSRHWGKKMLAEGGGGRQNILEFPMMRWFAICADNLVFYLIK